MSTCRNEQCGQPRHWKPAQHTSFSRSALSSIKLAIDSNVRGSLDKPEGASVVGSRNTPPSWLHRCSCCARRRAKWPDTCRVAGPSFPRELPHEGEATVRHRQSGTEERDQQLRWLRKCYSYALFAKDEASTALFYGSPEDRVVARSSAPVSPRILDLFIEPARPHLPFLQHTAAASFPPAPESRHHRWKTPGRSPLSQTAIVLSHFGRFCLCPSAPPLPARRPLFRRPWPR